MRIPPVLGFIGVVAITAIAYVAGQGSRPNVAAAPPAPAAAAEPSMPAVHHLSDDEEKELIAKVKSTWRTQTGETAEQITAKVAKVAHFIPRQWDVAYGGDGSKSVVLSWARHRTDKEGEEYTISWDINSDGTLALGPPYAKPMELGWQAFALSLIQSEIDDEDNGANSRFLHDISNLNFVQTAQGKLGDLLRRGRCVLGDPVGVDYVAKLSPDKDGDFFRLQLSVNCDIPGPRYFTRDGVILFAKRGAGAWQPQSFFAHRIAANPPGSWFERVDPKEQEFWETARRVFDRAGLPTSVSPFPK
jgi:hypothetical protein